MEGWLSMPNIKGLLSLFGLVHRGWERLRAGVRAGQFGKHQHAITHPNLGECVPLRSQIIESEPASFIKAKHWLFHRPALSNRTSLAQFSIVQILIVLLIFGPILRAQNSIGGGISGPTGGSGPTTNQNIRTIGANFGSFQSGATALSAASTSCIPTYFSGTIQAVEIIGNVSGSITIDVQTVLHSAWTGTASVSSITAAAIPALSAASKYTDTTLTGWTKTIAAGTDVCFVMSSPTTVAGASITLKVAAN